MMDGKRVKKGSILLGYMIQHCLFCGEDKECNECDVQKEIDKMAQED